MMKITVERKVLLEAVSIANFVISAKTVEEIFRNIKLEAKENTLFIFGTDRDTLIRQKVAEVEVEEEGSIVVSAQKVIDVLTKVLDEKINISADIEKEDRFISITTKRGKYKIFGINPEDYVEFPEVDWSNSIEIAPHDLYNMIQKTIFAAAAERTRYTLNGIFIKIGEKKIDMVA
ncbi:MAG: DNA polymerase III subunit beta, partial [Planctomycetota bacterium]